MNDWLIGVIHVVVAVLVFFFGWAAASSGIGWECRKVGMFYVGERVYECKLKENKDV